MTRQLNCSDDRGGAFVHSGERTERGSEKVMPEAQALRIDVNSEFEVLYALMEKLPSALKSGGKVAILTFHSGEDRIVKKAFKEWKKAVFTVRLQMMSSDRPQRNVSSNSRAKSTKMRWAIKA